MRNVWCTTTNSWVVCTPEIEAAMARGEAGRVNAGTESQRQTGDVQAGRRPSNVDAIATDLSRKITAAIIAHVVREMRSSSPTGPPALSTLDDASVTAAAERLQVARKAEGKELDFMTCVREVVAGREGEFLANLAREDAREHRERMRAFNRARQEPAPSLDEREAAVESDRSFYAEAGLISDREGIDILAAARKLEHTRTLEARLVAAKNGA
jgi:hypothetical protein